MIVAGGGGGAGGNYVTGKANGGSGSGVHGGASALWTEGTRYSAQSYGGTQTEGGKCTLTGLIGTIYDQRVEGSFGSGANSANGGGGGWYGGCGQYAAAGAGSGYIASSKLISSSTIIKHMVSFGSSSDDAETKTIFLGNVSASAISDYNKLNNGYARITYLGTSL